MVPIWPVVAALGALFTGRVVAVLVERAVGESMHIDEGGPPEEP
ncbi:MAG: hypothetical protein PVI57_02095 [Gemmatimonadota bacterium]|jgi:hypothetical protein